jgi:hypothetical protein
MSLGSPLRIFLRTSCSIAFASDGRRQALELRVLLAQLAQLPSLRRFQVALQLLPPVIALHRNTVLPTQLRHRRPKVPRPQNPRHVLDRKTLLLQDKTSYPLGLILSQNSTPETPGFLGAAQPIPDGETHTQNFIGRFHFTFGNKSNLRRPCRA